LSTPTATTTRRLTWREGCQLRHLTGHLHEHEIPRYKPPVDIRALQCLDTVVET
jgi:hypothetical protein